MSEQTPSQGIEHFMNRTEELVSTHGSTVVEAATSAIQWHGATNLLIGVVAIIIAVFCFKFVNSNATNTQEPPENNVEILTVVAIGLVSLGVGGFNLLNIWNWIAVFDPQTYFAHSLMKGYL